MGYLQIEGRIASIRRLSKAAFDILLFAPELAESAVPGQFLHIRCGEQPLRRPISICEIDRNIGALRIVFEVRGKGTAMQMPASWPVILHWPVPMCKSQRMMGRSAFMGL